MIKFELASLLEELPQLHLCPERMIRRAVDYLLCGTLPQVIVTSVKETLSLEDIENIKESEYFKTFKKHWNRNQIYADLENVAGRMCKTVDRLEDDAETELADGKTRVAARTAILRASMQAATLVRDRRIEELERELIALREEVESRHEQ